MTALNLFAMEDLPQRWAFIFGSEKGSDVVCKNSLNSQRVVSTEKKRQKERGTNIRNQAPPEPNDANQIQLGNATSCSQRRAWLDYKRFPRHLVKVKLTSPLHAWDR